MIGKLLPYLRRQTRRQLVIWIIALVVFLAAANLFLELAEEVYQQEALGWDITVMLSVRRASQPWLDELFWIITLTGGPLILVPLTLISWQLWRQGKERRALLFVISFVGTALLNSLLKAFFARPRPALFPTRVISPGYSFPSGHTMAAAAFFGMLALFLWQRGRYGWSLVAAAWVPLVAFSRIYLGAHFPSDVLASLALGITWLIIVWFTYTGHHVTQFRRWRELDWSLGRENPGIRSGDQGSQNQ